MCRASEKAENLEEEILTKFIDDTGKLIRR